MRLAVTSGADRQGRRRGILLALAVTLVAGCGEKDNAYVAPPPPAVTVARPTRQPVTNYLELNGNTRAVETVELRARVEGFLQQINFEDGSLVRQGQLLFLIDPKPFEAALREAEATVAQERARLDRATIEFARFDRLAKQRAAADTDVLQWRVERDSAQAALAGALAKADQAKLDLGYTWVTAPFDGRIGRRLVDVGNLVGAGESTHLATVVRLSPIYVYFNLSELDLLRLTDEAGAPKGVVAPQTQGLAGSRAAAIPLQMGLANHEGFPYQGRLDFADVGVDPASGTLLLRGTFANTDLRILPGLFVRVRVPVGEIASGILVPDRAIGTDQRGKYVYVVDADNKVHQTQVTLGALVDGQRVVLHGLQGDEWIIISGLQLVHDGVAVRPETVDGAPVGGTAVGGTAVGGTPGGGTGKPASPAAAGQPPAAP